MAASRFYVGLKRLTRNDVSWLESGSKSHQCAINLPHGGFAEMFGDILDAVGDKPRKVFDTHWYRQSGHEIASAECEVAFYRSKSEFRLMHIPRSKTRPVLKEGHLLAIRRSREELHITPLPVNGEHLVRELGRHDLVDRLP